VVSHAELKHAAAIASLGLIGCSTVNGDPVVVRSVDEVPRRCERVGSLGIGMGPSDSDTTPEAIEPELAGRATQIARSWDADVLVFHAFVENASESGILWCDCEVYRCPDDPAEAAEPVPLVALLANPEKYEGRLVEVTARAAVEYELAALFLNYEDKSHIAFKSAIALVGPESLFSELELPFGGYLRVIGRFSSASYLDMYGGQIGVHHLDKVDPYDPYGAPTCEDPPSVEPDP